MKKYLILISILLLATTSFAGDGIKAAIAAKNRAVAGSSQVVGDESTGGAETYTSPNYTYYYRLQEQAGQASSVDSITTQLDSQNHAGISCQYAIYTDDGTTNCANGSSCPTNLVTNSKTADFALTQSDTLSTYTYTYSSTKPSVSASTTYWIAVNCNTEAAHRNQASSGGSFVCYKSETHDTFANPAGSMASCSESGGRLTPGYMTVSY